MLKFDPSDVETYFCSFERLAFLNKWPNDKLCALLQSQMTGKGLRVFSELTLQDAQNYDAVKQAILDCYQLTPESYRVKFRDSEQKENETFFDYAFRLICLFKRWLESLKVFDDLEAVKETFLLEQFSNKIPEQITLWLLDRKPNTLLQAARFADEYVAVRKPFSPKSENSDSASVNVNYKHQNFEKGSHSQN